MGEEMTGRCGYKRGANQSEKMNPKLFCDINTTKLLARPGPPLHTVLRFLYFFRNSDPNAEIYLPNLFQWDENGPFFLVHWDKKIKLAWKQLYKNTSDFLEGFITEAKWEKKTSRKPLVWKKVDSSLLGVGCHLTKCKPTHTQSTQPTPQAALNTQFIHHTLPLPVGWRRPSIMFASPESHSILLQSPKEIRGRRLSLSSFHSSFSDGGIRHTELPAHTRCLVAT